MAQHNLQYTVGVQAERFLIVKSPIGLLITVLKMAQKATKMKKKYCIIFVVQSFWVAIYPVW